MKKSKFNKIRTIFKSIKNTKVLAILYKEGGVRYIEPYLYLCKSVNPSNEEKSTKIRYLLAYQIGGYSSSDQDFGWKLFKISDILGVYQFNSYPTFVKKPINLENSKFKQYKILCKAYEPKIYT